MTSNRDRAVLLSETLEAIVAGDQSALAGLLADDVRVWTPEVSTSTRADFLQVLDHRGEVFTGVELDIVAHDVGGDYACAEWTVAMQHTGPIAASDGAIVAASDALIELHGVAVAEFADRTICSLRQYWNERSLLEQIGVIEPNAS